ncbi:MAG: hypothetical protein RML93_01125 [Anaerolineales bacterium]|nr:hypothetical protein [Anaerolineales bacterium]MDW8445874.1 hypothetical protein [Anaerolineales bacterium]
MKYILTALLVIHGLIHLLGFVKAFDLAWTSQLQAAISRPMGILWLIASLLLVVSGGMVLLAGKWWWLPAALGVLLSQILVFTTWNDAKAGTIANVILLLPIIVAALEVAPWSFRALYNREIAIGLQRRPPHVKLLTRADTAHLPQAVQRYLEFVGAMDKPQIWNYRLRLSGALCNGPDDRWMPITAYQHSFTNPPARLFLIESSMFGVPFSAFHRYVGSEATFKVKLASLLTVVDAYGPEMNQSETVTLLNDMFLLAPTTLIDPNVIWEEIDPQTVRATFTNAGNTVSAVVTFDSSGALVDFVSDDRLRTIDGKTYEPLRWSTPVSDWREFDGRKLPLKGQAIWRLPTGEFAYGQFEILEVQYNVMGK